MQIAALFLIVTTAAQVVATQDRSDLNQERSMGFRNYDIMATAETAPNGTCQDDYGALYEAMFSAVEECAVTTGIGKFFIQTYNVT